MVVLDTSIVYKWFSTTEEKRNEAKSFLIHHLAGTEKIIIPDLLLYEITNVWSTKTVLTEEEAQENISLLQTYALSIIPSSFPLIKQSLQFSKKYSISVYDATYIVLAKEYNCSIITADEKLIKKVVLPFVKAL